MPQKDLIIKCMNYQKSYQYNKEAVMKKTKIVCTIGPASESLEKLADLIEKGMDVARLNFSHGNHDLKK